MNVNMVVIALMAFLVVISAAQAFQLNSLKSDLVGDGENVKASAPQQAPAPVVASAPPPAMVGGC